MSKPKCDAEKKWAIWRTENPKWYKAGEGFGKWAKRQINRARRRANRDEAKHEQKEVTDASS